MDLSRSEVADLVAMGPSAGRLEPERLEAALDGLDYPFHGHRLGHRLDSLACRAERRAGLSGGRPAYLMTRKIQIAAAAIEIQMMRLPKGLPSWRR